MFADRSDRKRRSRTTAKRLNDHDKHLTHGRFLSRVVLREFGLVIDDLEAIYPGDTARSQDFQDAALSVLHTATHAFVTAPQVNKIIENHTGKAFITSTPVPMPQMMRMPFPIPGPVVPPSIPPTPAPLVPPTA
jgi:hypothetical protein